MSDAQANQVAAAQAPTLRQLLNVVLSTVIVAALYLGRDFLIPLTLAVLLAFVLTPLVQALRRARVPRSAAVLLAVLAALAALLAGGAVIGSQVVSLTQDLPKYQGTIAAKVGEIGNLTTGPLTDLTGRLGVKAAHVGRQAAQAAGLTSQTAPKAPAAATPVEIVQAPPTPLQMARQILAPVVGPVATAGLVFVVAIFILFQQSDLRDRVIRLIGSNDIYRTTTAMNDAGTRLSRYFLSQVCVNAGFGVTVGTGLLVIDVPHSILWGALAALLRFIPFAGTLASGALAAAMAAAVDPGWSMVVWTVALFALVEGVTGQVVEPLIYGRSTGLSPVSVVVAAVFWTWLWGPVGLILSTPLSLCLLVLGRHIPQLEFIEVLLGDRPPLTPVESFYQRVLAGDADDLLQQAELALKDGPLSAYYDQVAIPGLLLATTDAGRRLLKRDQLPLLRGAVEMLISDLRDHADLYEHDAIAAPTDPAPLLDGGARQLPALAGAVLCICGPGMMDDLGALMLDQLLRRAGLETRIARYRDAARETVGSLDVSDVDAVCVMHLDVGGKRTRLRYLLGRLAQRAADRPIILVMPEADGAEILAEEIWPTGRRTKTLAAAVEACAAIIETSAPERAGRALAPSPQRSAAVSGS